MLRVRRHRGGVIVAGVGIDALWRLAPWVGWAEWQTECACKVKTAVAPAGRAAEWAATEDAG
eukprot:14231505-Alexandrium_andersonii.AAC.1